MNLKSIVGYLEERLLHNVCPTRDFEVSVESNLGEVNALSFVTKVEDIQELIEVRLASFSTIDSEKFNQALHSVLRQPH